MPGALGAGRNDGEKACPSGCRSSPGAARICRRLPSARRWRWCGPGRNAARRSDKSKSSGRFDDRAASPPHRRPDPGRSAQDPRRRHGLRRAGRELSGRPRRAVRGPQPDPLHHLPAGGRRLQHGRGLWQADGPARHLLRDPRPRRHQCLHRAAYRLPGFDADDPADRPGRPRPDRARGLPGDRLPPHVRAASPNGWRRSTTRGASPSW